ncbi:MAG TPA: HD domain-containing protein [Actinomycetota bacterium]|nr:HD domain-containing protein [Actinomycetota bacterium]
MDRTTALSIVKKRTTKAITYRHLVAVEGVMRALADHFGEDQDRWGWAGLFHDLDYDVTFEDHSQHPQMGVGWLRDAGFDDEQVLQAILNHRELQPDHDLMSRCLIHADAAGGLLVACALVRPEKAQGMKVSSVKKKLKEKSFAPGVERENVRNVEESIGLTLDEFLQISIDGLQRVAPEIELA